MAKPASRYIAAGILGVSLLGGGAWLATSHPANRVAPTRLVYTAQGYGGMMPSPIVRKAVNTLVPTMSPVRKSSVTPEQVALTAYAAGHYKEVEVAAAQVVARAAQQPTLPHRKAAAHAESLLAYAAARCHNLSLARDRFAVARKQAAALPVKEELPLVPGETPATLEEDDAFQHAVCTGALGDKPAAEAEYLALMRHYPESPLVQAAVKRIARMHGGDIPSADEAVWREAMQVAQTRQAARQREASLCGPECLAELLRRRGKPAEVHALARQMNTSERGTTLAALARAAQAHGFHPQGFALTPRGLRQQRLPVIALVRPGHYVLVEATTPENVTIWDPNTRGIGQGDHRTLRQSEWQRAWHGVTLALAAPSENPAPTIQTARR